MSKAKITRATSGDRTRVIDTFVAAFRTDPAIRFVFPDDTSYGERAAAFAGHRFDKRVASGTVWTIEGGASVAMWEAPFTPSPDDGVDGPELSLPADEAARLAEYDAIVHAALPSTPHWYLGVLATHPAHAGQRWGRALMADGLRRAGVARLPAYLEVTNPANVELYRRSGWRVTDTVAVRGVRVWIMTHPGLPPAPSD